MTHKIKKKRTNPNNVHQNIRTLSARRSKYIPDFSQAKIRKTRFRYSPSKILSKKHSSGQQEYTTHALKFHTHACWGKDEEKTRSLPYSSFVSHKQYNKENYIQKQNHQQRITQNNQN